MTNTNDIGYMVKYYGNHGTRAFIAENMEVVTGYEETTLRPMVFTTSAMASFYLSKQLPAINGEWKIESFWM